MRRFKLTLPAAQVAALMCLFSSPAAAAPSGIDIAAIDRSVRPGDDFDAYASGAWWARTVIPPDKQSVGAVEDLSDQIQAELHGLIQAAAARPATHDAKLIGDLYAAFMDEATVEAIGDKPLREELARLAKIDSKSDLAAYMARTQSGFGRGLFLCDVWVDLKHPTQPALRLRQDGLGLGVREAYADAATVTAYHAYIARTLALAGWPRPAETADEIVALESRIAAASWTVAENADRVKRYNPTGRADLKAFAPGFAWDAYLDALGARDVDRIFVQQKSAMPKLAAVFAETPLSVLKGWEAFQVADSSSPFLSRAYVENRFAFRGRVLDGLESDAPRWKRAVSAVDELLPEPLGHAFMDRHFDTSSRAAVEAMGQEFKAAMAARIRALSWMAPSTKAAALAKLERVRFLVGGPTAWRDYHPLAFRRADLYGAVTSARAFNWSAEVAQLKRPVNPDNWFLPPQAVDAFSDQARTAIGVPAGILQPPFFQPGADPASSYGMLGEIMGHELTHQFDDQGRKYGADGALADWWTAADAERFDAAASKLAAQFDSLEALPGVKLNGRQTLSENIADLGGLLLALDAYHLSLGGKPAPVIDGLSGDQRVFLGWARVFRSKDREESLKSQAASGSHTPFKFRAIGPMRNVDAWYNAFGVTPGDRYYVAPADRVRIW